MIAWTEGVALAKERAVVTIPGPNGPRTARVVYWPVPASERRPGLRKGGAKVRVELGGHYLTVPPESVCTDLGTSCDIGNGCSGAGSVGVTTEAAPDNLREQVPGPRTTPTEER